MYEFTPLSWAFSIVWILISAYLFAQVEINIEGKDGWAKNLPTWRLKNKFTELFLSETPITGYHFWMFFMIFSLFHFPFILGLSWSVGVELKIIVLFTSFFLIEDFLWFVLNPAYGISKLNKKHAVWHKEWVGFFPLIYLKAFIFIAFILYLSSFIS